MMAPPQRGGATLSDYVQMVWQRRWTVAAFVLVAAGIAFATRPPVPQPIYSSTVSLRVQTFSFSSSSISSIVPTEGVPPAEIQAARSVEVAAETAQDLGLSGNGADLLASLVVTAQEGTDLLQLNLTGPGQKTTERLQVYAENYVEFRNEQDDENLEQAVADFQERIDAIEPRLQLLSDRVEAEAAGGDISPVTQTQFDTVSASYADLVRRLEQLRLDAALTGNQIELIGSPISQSLGSVPTRTLRLLAGPIVGLLLGCAVAVGLGVLRPRISGRERTEERLGFPVLATIPRVRERRIARDPILLQRTSGWAAEGLRMLRTELQLIEERGTPLKLVVLASPEPRDGKSTVAANLAGSYASTGKTAVLVHADLRAVRKRKSEPHGGLTDYIAGRTHEIPVTRNAAGFDEVLAGPSSIESSGPSSPQEMLVGAVRRLAERYDIVIIDTAPLLAFADALLLAIEAAAVVLVLRNGKTLEDKAAEALDVLVRHDAAVAGIVLNDISVGRLERYRYRRYYGAWTEGGPSTASDAAPIGRTVPQPPPQVAGGQRQEAAGYLGGQPVHRR